MSYRGFTFLLTKLLPGGLDAFCEALTDDGLRQFIRQPFLASVRYDILPFLPLYATLSRLLDVPFESLVRRTTEAQARYDAQTVFKAIWTNCSIEAIAERISRFGAQYYDFGKVTGLVEAPNVLVITHEAIPSYAVPWFGPMHVAYTEECMRLRGGKDVRSLEEAPVVIGMREGFSIVTLRTEFRWRAK